MENASYSKFAVNDLAFLKDCWIDLVANMAPYKRVQLNNYSYENLSYSVDRNISAEIYIQKFAMSCTAIR